ncbi:hypothetical protein L227DRAFT_576978 [Lentinus tigrinus ALCF2SS1-6]|uniref:Uncharacterized protein n=1 Tax=Lentinus tigrinus ALCF2SS1-6 TaxID=1328759 RepID=A0A5C2S6D0_9APHY|nr:hypothetical protein L227DRAFT_576978 [Lentinus tigrinus ALCF2SS1-6]
MSSSANPGLSGASLPPIPPEFQALLTANVNLLIIDTVFPVLLVPIGIGLFLFSTPELRRKPIFILNVVSIILGLAFGSIAIYSQAVNASGRAVPTQYLNAIIGFYILIPICVQCILLLRIVAVYPPYALSLIRRILIYGTLGAILIARVINAGIGLHKLAQDAERTRDWEVIGHLSWILPNSRVEWFLQLFYDLLASMLFLLRIRQSNVFKPKDYESGPVATAGKKWSYAARLRALFWIALSNLIIPVIFNIAVLIMVYTGVDFIRGGDVVMVNPYVEIIGVLLATLVCSSGTQWGNVAIHSAHEDPVILGHGHALSMPSMKFTSVSGPTSQVHSNVNDGSVTV